MKKATRFFLFSLFLFIFFSCSHEDFKVLTTIHEDGSCERVFTANADSAFMVGDTATSNPFTFPLDGNWIITWQYRSPEIQDNWPLKSWEWEGQEKNVTVHARKHFPSVDSMARFDYLSQGDWSAIRPKVHFDKEFRWFYTYYTFQETYPGIKAFQDIPLTEYLSEKEARMWLQGTKPCFEGMNGIEAKEYLDKISEKADEWMNHNLFEIQYKILVKHLDRIPGRPASQDELMALKDTVFELNNKHDSYPELRGIYLDSLFRTRAFSSFIEEDSLVEKEVEASLDFYHYFGESMEYRLIMPGKLLSTSSGKLLGDTLVWNIDTYRFMEYDYAMQARSRKANAWAFVLSALLLLGVMSSFLLPVKKKARDFSRGTGKPPLSRE